MENMTPQQKKKLERLLEVEQGGTAGILKYLFELEEKIDEEIPGIKDIMERVKGDKGDSYVLEDDDKEEISQIVRQLINDDELANKVLSKITIDYDIIAKKASEYVKVPQAEKVDYKKIKSEVLKDIAIPKAKDGKDADEEKICEKIEEDLIKDLPKYGEQFRDGLELLQDDERLDRKAIKGLENYDEVLKNAFEANARVISNTRNFYQLLDAPAGGYVGQAGKVLKVRADENGLEWGTGGGGETPSLQEVTDVGASTTNGIAINRVNNQQYLTANNGMADKVIVGVDTVGKGYTEWFKDDEDGGALGTSIYGNRLRTELVQVYDAFNSNYMQINGFNDTFSFLAVGSGPANIIAGQATLGATNATSLLVNETVPYDNSASFESYGKGGFYDGTNYAYFATGTSAGSFTGDVFGTTIFSAPGGAFDTYYSSASTQWGSTDNAGGFAFLKTVSFSQSSAGGEFNWYYNNETAYNGIGWTSIDVNSEFGGNVYHNANPEEGVTYTALDGATGFNFGGGGIYLFANSSNMISQDGGGIQIGDGTLGIDLNGPIVYSNGQHQFGLGSTSAPSIAFQGNSSTGFNNTGNNDIIIVNNNAISGMWNASGQLGLGTVSQVARLDVNGGQTNKVTTVSASTATIAVTDRFISVTRTATGTCTLTLPTAASCWNSTSGTGIMFYISDTAANAGTNNITINRASTNTIVDATTGNTSKVINTNGGSIRIQAINSTTWKVL